MATRTTSYGFTVDLALLVPRLAVGLIFFIHGSQKMFGWFDGPGLEKIVEMLGLGPVGYLVAVGECFGGLGLLLGVLSRFSAAAITLIMLGAVYIVHGKNGFFLDKGGFEFNLALIALCWPTLIAGPGPFAIGRFLPLPKVLE